LTAASARFWPNSYANCEGRVNTEGTEAAGEFVMSPESCEKLLQKVGVGRTGPIFPFEAIIRLNSVGGASSTSEIVIARRVS